MRRVRLALSIAMVGMALAASPALADKGDSVIRFGAQFVGPTGDLTETEMSLQATLEAQGAAGLFFAYEYFLTDMIGIEPSLSYQKHDIDVTLRELISGLELTTKFGETTMMPLLVAVNFHVMRGETVDLWVAPIVGYVSYGDLEVIGEQTVKMKDGFGWGADVGVDVRFGQSNWSFTGALQFLKTAAETDEADVTEQIEMDVDPIILRAGVTYRF